MPTILFYIIFLIIFLIIAYFVTKKTTIRISLIIFFILLLLIPTSGLMSQYVQSQLFESPQTAESFTRTFIYKLDSFLSLLSILIKPTIFIFVLIYSLVLFQKTKLITKIAGLTFLIWSLCILFTFGGSLFFVSLKINQIAGYTVQIFDAFLLLFAYYHCFVADFAFKSSLEKPKIQN